MYKICSLIMIPPKRDNYIQLEPKLYLGPHEKLKKDKPNISQSQSKYYPFLGQGQIMILLFMVYKHIVTILISTQSMHLFMSTLVKIKLVFILFSIYYILGEMLTMEFSKERCI